ncbi:MAG TPA: polyprenyl synthetase family protein [Pseudonocardiaceae bacterium]|jgi:geranylgeranyl diphosphate synthase type I|nr:polyprenyl synthetase family protein [Pseudonocardiaceae bacterium]
MSGTDLATKLDGYRAHLRGRLEFWLETKLRDRRMHKMAAYHLGWLDADLMPATAPDTGKHLRPALCFLACEHVGAGPERALPGAAAVELVHNFSLVHDDIQDGSPLRRHRATVWSLWGVGQGINVGDGLFTLAQLALLELDDGGTGLPPAIRIEAAGVLNHTCLALCEGQVRDLDFVDRPADGLRGYLAMIAGKTGALFGCAAELGALLGGAPADVVRRFGRFGRALGAVYQMRDDIAGVWGDPDETGKLPTDIVRRKHGLPTTLATISASDHDRAELCALYACGRPLDESEVDWVIGLFDRLGIRDEAERLAARRLDRVERLLHAVAPAPDLTGPLAELIDVVAGRVPMTVAAEEGR